MAKEIELKAIIQKKNEQLKIDQNNMCSSSLINNSLSTQDTSNQAMVWDLKKNKLIQKKVEKEIEIDENQKQEEDNISSDYSNNVFEEPDQQFQDPQDLEQKLRQNIIKHRNKELKMNFTRFVQKKYKKLEFKQKYIEVSKKEIFDQFNDQSLREQYMRKMKFKSSIDLISYDEFIHIFYDF